MVEEGDKMRKNRDRKKAVARKQTSLKRNDEQLETKKKLDKRRFKGGEFMMVKED